MPLTSFGMTFHVQQFNGGISKCQHAVHGETIRLSIESARHTHTHSRLHPINSNIHTHSYTHTFERTHLICLYIFIFFSSSVSYRIRSTFALKIAPKYHYKRTSERTAPIRISNNVIFLQFR